MASHRKTCFFCWELLFKDAGRGKVYSGWFSWFIGHWFDECCWWLIFFLKSFFLGILTMDISSLFCLKVDLSACFWCSFMATLRSSSFWQGHLEVQLRHHITNLRREAGVLLGLIEVSGLPGYLTLVEEWVPNNKVPSRKKCRTPHHCRSIMISLTCFYRHGCWKHKHSQRSHVIKLFRQGLEGTRWLMIWCCVFH